MIRIGAGRPWNRSSIRGRDKRFSSQQRPDRLWGALHLFLGLPKEHFFDMWELRLSQPMTTPCISLFPVAPTLELRKSAESFVSLQFLNVTHSR
jgi:hypothetical protein